MDARDNDARDIGGATNPDVLETDASGQGISRRDLLKQAGAAGIVIAIPGGIVAEAKEAAPKAKDSAPGAFTAAEMATLSAMIGRLIPTDASGPGGVESGVPGFIDQMVASPFAAHHRGPYNADAPLRDAYTAGLKATDAYSQSAHGAPFANLSPDKQDAVITAMQDNKATGFTPDSRNFFGLVREHSVWGMFGDPYYGGNKNFAGWDLLDFSGIKLVFTPEEQKLDVQVKPAHKGTTEFAIFAHSRKGM